MITRTESGDLIRTVPGWPARLCIALNCLDPRWIRQVGNQVWITLGDGSANYQIDRLDDAHNILHCTLMRHR